MENTTLTRALSLDCEMVGTGPYGNISILARVSIVNENGECVYDRFVKATDPVTNYRTKVSGIRPQDLKNGADFNEVRKTVGDMLKGRILVGHSVNHDLTVLKMNHPKSCIRDTFKYEPFVQMNPHRKPSLRFLAYRILNRDIQGSEHSSVEDAKACMDIYKKHKNAWEKMYTQNNASISGYIDREQLSFCYYQLATLSGANAKGIDKENNNNQAPNVASNDNACKLLNGLQAKKNKSRNRKARR